MCTIYLLLFVNFLLTFNFWKLEETSELWLYLLNLDSFLFLSPNIQELNGWFHYFLVYFLLLFAMYLYCLQRIFCICICNKKERKWYLKNSDLDLLFTPAVSPGSERVNRPATTSWTSVCFPRSLMSFLSSSLLSTYQLAAAGSSEALWEGGEGWFRDEE